MEVDYFTPHNYETVYSTPWTFQNRPNYHPKRYRTAVATVTVGLSLSFYLFRLNFWKIIK
jgi:hypothetical protein